MSFGNDSLPTAVLTAKEQDLKPLLEESAEALELDERQIAEMEAHLHSAWFFGVRIGHEVMVGTSTGQAPTDPAAAIQGVQDEFQALMEQLAEALNTSVGSTIAAWDYLGRAWIAGARFWEVEIAARLIESKSGEFEEWRRRLED
jgi:hypothetical protein